MKYTGVPVSQGVAIGQVFIYEPTIPEVSENFISPADIDTAIAQYHELLNKARAELVDIQLYLKEKDPDKAMIFEAHVEMLLDTVMIEEIIDSIKSEYFSPEWAIQIVYDKYINMFSETGDELIMERVADMHDLRIRKHRIWFGVSTQNLSALSKPVVIVAHDLLPSDTATLDRKNVLGIVTEIGGSTSHTAIIARGYGIPAVLGIPNILEFLKNDETVIVDALEGTLITQPCTEQLELYAQMREKFFMHKKELMKFIDVKPVTPDGIYIDVHLNIASAESDELSDSKFTDGVGLFRTEFLYMTGTTLPTEEEQYTQYKKVAEEFGDRPVILRTLDIGGDKQVDTLNLPKEDNPFLGLRALRLCLENTSLFKTQLRAAFRAGLHGNIWIMLPMVGSLDDVRAAKAIINDVKESLTNENISFEPTLKIGIMIEIPSIALISDLVVKEVDFASIGTNDLCQYLTAVDRLNPAVSDYYQSYHPAMFRVIQQVIEAFNCAGKPISICGEMGGDPLAAAVLIGLGIRKLSMNSSCIPGIKKLITELSIEKAQDIAKKALTCATANELEGFLEGMNISP